MTSKRSFNSPVQIADESSYGTEATVDEPLGRVQEITCNFNNNPHVSWGAGAGRRPQSTSYGNVDCSWSFMTELHRANALKYAIGPQTGSGTAGSPYLFTEATAESELPSFTMESGHSDGTDVVDVLTGCVCESWTISGGISGPVTLRMSGKNKTFVTDTAITSYTEPTTDTFMAHQANVYWGTSPTLIGQIQSWAVTCNNGIAMEREAGTRFYVGYSLGRLQYSFTLTVLLTNDVYVTLRNAAYGQSSGPVSGVTSAQMDETNELRILISEGSSTGNRNIEIWLDPAFLSTVEKSFTLGDDLILATITGTSHGGKSNNPVRHWTA